MKNKIRYPVFYKSCELDADNVNQQVRITKMQKEYKNQRISRMINGKVYHFRSKQEYKVALYLELLKTTGHIKNWSYETTKFHFPNEEDPVKTWVVDFDVLENNGNFYYIEYKGFVEADTRRKLALLNKYRSEIKLDMVFENKRDMKKLGKRATSQCRRVCLLQDLTREIM